MLWILASSWLYNYPLHCFVAIRLGLIFHKGVHCTLTHLEFYCIKSSFWMNYPNLVKPCLKYRGKWTKNSMLHPYVFVPPFAVIIYLTILGKFWSMVVGVCAHSSTREIVKSGSAVRWEDSGALLNWVKVSTLCRLCEFIKSRLGTPCLYGPH